MSKFEDAVARLRRIEPTRAPAGDEELSSRFARYLTELAAMCREHGIPLRAPLTFNAAQLLDGDVPAQLREFEQTFDEIVGSLPSLCGKVACWNYLAWCVGLDQDLELPRQYPHLFEPLLEVVEMGGYLGIDEGNLMVGNSVFSINAWRRTAAVTVEAPR